MVYTIVSREDLGALPGSFTSSTALTNHALVIFAFGESEASTWRAEQGRREKVVAMIVFRSNTGSEQSPYGELHYPGAYQPSEVATYLRELEAHLGKQETELKLKEAMATLTLSVAASNYTSTDEIAEQSLGALTRAPSNMAPVVFVRNHDARGTESDAVENALGASYALTKVGREANVCVHVHMSPPDRSLLFTQVLAARRLAPAYSVHVHVVVCKTSPAYFLLQNESNNNPSLVPYITPGTTTGDPKVDSELATLSEKGVLRGAFGTSLGKQATQPGFFRAVAASPHSEVVANLIPSDAKFPPLRV